MPENRKCCCEAQSESRTKERSETEKKALLNRLARIEGQLRGIRRMVEENAWCPDILTQSAAVSSAMDAFSRELLSNHIQTCVVHDIREGRDETVDELIRTLRRFM